MSAITNLKVDRIEERTNSTDQSKFAVAIIAGLAFTISESGNSRFDKREVSIPLSNMSVKDAKSPETKQVLNEMVSGMEIYRKEVEPYTYEVPGTDRTITLEHSWDIRPKGSEQSQPEPAKKQSTTEPVLDEVGND